MTAELWLPPLVKALATGLLVVSASALAESLGPFWGALIASLPVSAGPAYVFLAMQHGADFVAASALSSFAVNAATGLFLIVYGLLAQRLSPWRGLMTAVLAWLLNLVVYGVGFGLLKAARRTEAKSEPVARRRRFDLPVRAVAVAAFVSVVVAVSSILGPNVTGIAAVFPISLISLIVIVRPRIGSLASSLLAANALRSMLGFGMMLLTLHLAIPVWGTATALIMALLVSVFWSAGMLLLRRRQRLA
jgi:hypothetical protein